MAGRGPHQRKCHDCGNVAEHQDNVVPHVLCKKCGSQDTRLVKVNVSPLPPAIDKQTSKTTIKIQSLEISYSGDSQEVQKLLAGLASMFGGEAQ
jgi:DNA-directed RNA polymerase subunit RPC12/RpoP